MSGPVTHTWQVDHASARARTGTPPPRDTWGAGPAESSAAVQTPAPREHSASTVALGALACALLAAGAWLVLRSVARALGRAWGPLRAYLSARERRAKLRDRGDAHQLVATTAATLAEQVRELSAEIQRLRVKAGEVPAPADPATLA